ncbi:MAG: hypothetical protein IPI45_13735 [Saprospiraceae bacterium]|nr:hypothetical protein [Saprospiraceae bacterium]MBK7738829.1 hypothetical protein [Saprospiraceae bacterium]MBK7912599.1 hypothetical protein [Saprospiraceae bacterium]
MELNEKQFVSGFNSGFVLAEHEPAMLNILLTNIRPTNSYITGLQSGQKEYQTYKANIELSNLRIAKNRDSDLREL